MMLQTVLAALLVLVSAVYASWRLMPAQRRLWLLEHLLPAERAERGWLARWRGRVVADALRSCAGCSAHSAKPPRSSAPVRRP